MRPTFEVAAVLLLGCTCAPGQHPVRHNLVGEVRDDGGKPLAGAMVHFAATPVADLWVLRDHAAALAGAPEVETARTDPRGRFQLRVARPRGALWVVHAGLGALLVDPPPRAQLLCQPLAELRLPGGPATAHIMSAGGRCVLQTGRADAVRLPSGAFRVLITAPDRVAEYGLLLRAGETVTLPAAAPPRRLEVGTATTVTMTDWPAVTLPRPSPTSVLIPGGEVVVDLSLWVAASGCRLVARRWAGASAETLVPPTAHTRILKVFSAATGEPLRGARVLAVDATQDESAELRSIGDTDASGRAGFALPAPTASTQVVVSAPGYGTVVVPPPEDGSNEVRLPTAVAARQQVLDPTGGPATHLAVHIEHPGSWLLTQVAFADGGGMVRLELPRGTYGMRPWHPHYLNRARTLLVTGRDDPPPIRCEPGFRVHGRILLPDGKPARGAVVTLRDSTDARVRRRTAVCDRDGGFQISGLPEHARMRLSARLTQSDGRAFISEQIWVQPELEDVELRLKSEDPPLPGRR